MRWTLRAVGLFLFLCLAAVAYHIWQWGLAQRERGDLLAEQNRLRVEIAESKERENQLAWYAVEAYQKSLHDVVDWLGLDLCRDSTRVVQAQIGAKAVNQGVGGGVPGKAKPGEKRGPR